SCYRDWSSDVCSSDLLLADLCAYYGAEPVRILIDDRPAAAQLRPALLAVGYAHDGATTYLAHVGPVPAADPIPGLTIEAVDETRSEERRVGKGGRAGE